MFMCHVYAAAQSLLPALTFLLDQINPGIYIYTSCPRPTHAKHNPHLLLARYNFSIDTWPRDTVVDISELETRW